MGFEWLFDRSSVELLDERATLLINRGAYDIAKDTLRLKGYIEQSMCRVEIMYEQLSDIFDAIEWCDISDVDEELLREKIEAYRNGQQTPPFK